MVPRGLLVISVLLLAFAATAPLATAGTPAQDLAWLNAKRATNGIPGDITLNPDWSAKCAQHVAYMRATNTVAHPEDPTSANYSDGGNWAGTHSVLASTVPWTESAFIWETAPLHLAQLLAPQLSQVGIIFPYPCVLQQVQVGYSGLTTFLLLHAIGATNFFPLRGHFLATSWYSKPFPFSIWCYLRCD